MKKKHFELHKLVCTRQQIKWKRIGICFKKSWRKEEKKAECLSGANEKCDMQEVI